MAPVVESGANLVRTVGTLGLLLDRGEGDLTTNRLPRPASSRVGKAVTSGEHGTHL